MTVLSPDLARYACRLMTTRREELASAGILPDDGTAMTDDQRTLMTLLAGSLPLTDLADRPVETLLDYIDHALMLRATVPWTRALPEDVFVHFVFWPRVNNERLEPCRSRIHEELMDRVEGLTPERAVIETNVWCAEHMTYTPSDERTLSPFGALNRGRGRCGEESTLLVHALRAIGIPARQVYAPRWAHCDDNHAWVEALVDGAWHFLGACEPEEQLDRGWFDRAATRAMLLHTRVFCGYTTGTVDVSASAGTDGGVLLENRTAAYAPVTTLKVTVLRPDGSSAAGAQVTCELLNEAQLVPVATLTADDGGRTTLKIGRGSLMVRASSGTMSGETLVDAAACDSSDLNVSVTLGADAAGDADDWQPITFTAPAGSPPHAAAVSPGEQAEGARRAAAAEQTRAAGMARYAAAAHRRAAADGIATGAVDRLLADAGGNWPVIEAFLTAAQDDDERLLRVELLNTLSAKDLADVSGTVLEDALRGAHAVRGYAADLLRQVPEKERMAVMMRALFNPRVADEELAGDRMLIRRLAGDDGRDLVRTQPRALYALLDSYATVPPNSAVPPMAASTLLRTHRGTRREAALAFVTICRALGVPAQLDPMTGAPQYHDGTGFVNACRTTPGADAGTPSAVPVTLLAPEDMPEPRAGVDFTVARREVSAHGTDWHTLNLTADSWDDRQLTLRLTPGVWRMITTVRLPNGDQLAAVRQFRLTAAGSPLRLPLSFRRPNVNQLLEHLPLENLPLRTADGQPAMLRDLAAGGRTLLLVLDAHGSEPSIHVVQELAELAARSPEALRQVRPLLALTPADAPVAASLTSAMAHLPFTPAMLRCDGQVYERLARTGFVDPGKTPLLLVLEPGDGEAAAYARYACSGYNVGSVELAMKLALY